jgi:hypothetical protein
VGPSGCVGDPGGTVGWLSGFVLGGISGAVGPRVGDVAGGVCCEQLAVTAARAIAARIDLGAFIFALLFKPWSEGGRSIS